MKILQIGAGSMGTRRLRDLRARKDVTLAVFDARSDRLATAARRFEVTAFDDFNEALAWKPAALIVSTPPGAKGLHLDLALKLGLHHFAEADIWTYGVAPRATRRPGVVAAASASMDFLPIIRAMQKLIPEKVGRLIAYQANLTTYMPDWHKGEDPERYYAWRRHTAAAREMVPFELTYLHGLFGGATDVAGRFDRLGELPGEAEDTWSLAFRLPGGAHGQLLVNMSCPRHYRAGTCLGTTGFVNWDLQAGTLTAHASDPAKSEHFSFGPTAAAIESAYAEEINAFVDAALGRSRWLHDYRVSQHSSATLAAAEKSSITGRWVKVDPSEEPAPVQTDPPKRR